MAFVQRICGEIYKGHKDQNQIFYITYQISSVINLLALHHTFLNHQLQKGDAVFGTVLTLDCK